MMAHDFPTETWPPAPNLPEPEQSPTERRGLLGSGLAVALVYNLFAQFALRRQYPQYDHVGRGTQLPSPPTDFWDNAEATFAGIAFLLCLALTVYEAFRNGGKRRMMAITFGVVSMALVLGGSFGFTMAEEGVDP